MADRDDYYRRDDERENDVYLDNRTGVGAPQGRGYRASFETGRGGGRQQQGQSYGEDNSRGQSRDQGSSTYGSHREVRSFRPDDYRADDGRGSYSNESARDYQTGSDQQESYGYRGQPGGGALQRPRERSPSSYEGGATYGGDARNVWNRAGDTVASWLGDDEARRRHEADVRASHRGKGPKGYKRSDERIREDVSERLTDDHWLDASNVEVQVNDSEVTLSGTVVSRDDRRHAERIAESVSGATHVQNNLRVDENAGRDQGATNAQGDILARQAAGKH